MIRCFRVAALLLFAILGASTAEAARFRPPSVVDLLHANGGYVVPAEWAGIWQTTDSTYKCTPRTLDSFAAYLDTICQGTSYEPDTTGGFYYNCTGTVTTTAIDLTCTATILVPEFGCEITYVIRTIGSRTGETAVYTSRVTTTFNPSMCFGLEDSCLETVSRVTRIAPEPPTCTTATLPSTWGAIKSRYR